MASPIWIGTTAVWTTNANWSTNDDPNDADIVLFTGAVTQSVDGLTLGAGEQAFALLAVHEDWAGDIGSSGTPVTCTTLTRLEFKARSGRCYWNSATSMTTVIYSASSGRSDALTLGGAGTIGTLRIENASGGVSVTAGGLTTVEMVNSPNCILTIASGVTGLTTITLQGGGTIDNSAVVTGGTGTVVINGGRYIRRGTGTIEQLEMYGTGDVSILEDYATGTITAGIISGPGCLYDGRGNRSTAAAITSINGRNRARILLDNGMNTYAASIVSDGTITASGGSLMEIES